MTKAISQEYAANRVLYYLSSFRGIIEKSDCEYCEISEATFYKILNLEINNLEHEVRTEWL